MEPWPSPRAALEPARDFCCAWCSSAKWANGRARDKNTPQLFILHVFTFGSNPDEDLQSKSTARALLSLVLSLYHGSLTQTRQSQLRSPLSILSQAKRCREPKLCY
jgi:hypothetical protein